MVVVDIRCKNRLMIIDVLNRKTTLHAGESGLIRLSGDLEDMDEESILLT